MAGIGVKLNNIFEKRSVFTNLVGFTYSTIATVAPMALVILNILLVGRILGLNQVAYLDKELFSCTVLYTFIFALLTAVLLFRTDDEHCFQLSCGNTILPVGTFYRRSGCVLRIYRLLRLYFAGDGFLLHALSFCM